MKRKLNLISAFFILFVMIGCKDRLEYPPNSTLAEDALQTPEDLQALLNSNYDVLANVFDGSIQNIAELMGDNLNEPENSIDYRAVFFRETDIFTPNTGQVYQDLYTTVYRANVLLANFDLIDGLNEDERRRMEAEARFIRALCHWQAVKLWAQPYGYTSDNSHLGVVIREEASQAPLVRNTVGEVYEFIIEDLAFAYGNLPDANDVYATRYSAAGLLAQVYFLMGNYQMSSNFASEVIDSGVFQLDTDLDRYEQNFVNSETVFGIIGDILNNRSERFRDNYRSDDNPSPELTFSPDFAQILFLNSADNRNDWITPNGNLNFVARFNDKEYFNVPIVHLTGLKLIRAEAYAELGINLEIAINDVNDIRDRAFGEGLNDLDPNADAIAIRDAAREEYRIETVCEGVWIDQLKRRGAMGENILVRGAPYDCPGMALQFPSDESAAAGFIMNTVGGCN